MSCVVFHGRIVSCVLHSPLSPSRTSLSRSAAQQRAIPGALDAADRIRPQEHQGRRQGAARGVGGRRPFPARARSALRRREVDPRDRRRQRLQRHLARPRRARDRGGRVVAIEYDPQRAKEAAANIRKAGLTDVVRVVHGDAFKEIPKLQGTFDLVFLDAWKPDYKRFFDMVYPAAGRRAASSSRTTWSTRRPRWSHSSTPCRTTRGLFTSIVSPGRGNVGVVTRRQVTDAF